MRDKTTTYNITDDEGDTFKVEYIHTPCRCCPMGCSPDKLIIYDYPEFGGEEEIEEYARVVEDILDDLENDNIFGGLFEYLTLEEYQHLLCRYAVRECPINFLSLTAPELTEFEYAVKDYLLKDKGDRSANYDILLHVILTALKNYTIVYTP